MASEAPTWPSRVSTLTGNNDFNRRRRKPVDLEKILCDSLLDKAPFGRWLSVLRSQSKRTRAMDAAPIAAVRPLAKRCAD